LIACDVHVLYAAACLICAAVTASAHLHLAAQDRPCSSQHHLDNRHRKTKASINQDLSTLTKLDFQTTKHFGHASAKFASLSPFTSTDPGDGEAPKPDAATQTPTRKHPTRIEHAMLPLYDPVFAEKQSHHDLPPSFVWNRRKVPVSPSCPFQPSTAPAHTSPKTAATHSHHGEAPSPEGDKKACPITSMLATQASFDPVLKALMKVVAADKATPEQIKAFEYDAVIQPRKAKKVAKEEKRLAKQNETATKPEDSKPIRRDSTQGQTGDDLAGTRNKVGSGRQEEFEESSSRERAAARQKAESSSIDSRDRTGGRITAEQKIKSEARIQASWVDNAYFACKANSKVCKLPLNFVRRRTDCLITESIQERRSSDCIGPGRLQQVLPDRFT
jgi:hypothetical protein